METDKRPFYIWMMVLVANISTVIFLIATYYRDNGKSDTRPLLISFLISLGISLFLTVIPVLISKWNSKWANRFGYGIPVLLLLPIPYFIWHNYTCVGKFCNLFDILFAWFFGLSATVFAIFYTIGVYSRKWSPGVVLFISFIISVSIMGGLWFLMNA